MSPDPGQEALGRQTTAMSDECQRCLPEISTQYRHRVRAEPVVEDARVHGAEIGLERDVVAAVLERGIADRVERGGGAVEAALDAAAQCEHQTCGAVVVAGAAV